MSAPGIGEVLSRLDRLIRSGDLGQGSAATARRLHERLSAPVRVLIAGPPGGGKTTLANLILSRNLLPVSRPHPRITVTSGPPGLTLTYPDGSEESYGIEDLGRLPAGAGARMTIRAPDPILERISLTEEASGGKATIAGTAALAEAEADIVLWVSQGFSEDERAAWEGVPEHLKDHAFYVLTKADLLAAEGALDSRIAAVADAVGDEFHSLVPVATLQGLSAVDETGKVDRTLLRASGGAALIDEILRHATEGRQADIDGTLLFLERHREIEASLAARAETAPAEAATEPGADPAPAGTAEEPDGAGGGPEPTDASPTAPGEALLADAVAYLRGRGEELTALVASEGPGSVLPHCAESIDMLAERFAPFASEGEDRAALVARELAAASEMMVLMQLERGGSQAADAVAILLQIRRDAEIGLAA